MKLLKNKKIRIAVISIAVILIVLAGAGGYYVLRVNSIRENGVKLTPSQSYEVRDVDYYLQNDPLWSDEKIGDTSQGLGSAGCLIACAASAISDLGFDITPSELNKKMSEIGGFSGANLIWFKIHEAIPEVHYKYSRIFTVKTIENDLKQGLLPIVNVKYRGSGATHWVLIIGADGTDFLIYDPLNADKTPLPLATHGNVYSYRVLLKS